MALSPKLIKGKIKSVKNVGKITKAMELVSVSKMKRATSGALSARAYTSRALSLLAGLSRLDTPAGEKLLNHGSRDRNLIVIVSSNKGLCGSYNVNVERATRNFIKRIRAKHETDIDVVCVGKKAERIASVLQLNIIASFVEFSEAISIDEAYILSILLHEEFMKGAYYNVVLVYTEYESALSNHVVVRQLYPFKPENLANMIDEEWKTVLARQSQKDASLENYITEPAPDELRRKIIVRLAHTQIYQALLEANASEHSARMFAMKNATDNAKQLADKLTLSFNQARQASITRELSEIAAGADALSV
jgi:F-type H+-transporting ATPase subunit gamma